MLVETTLEMVPISLLKDNDITTNWFDYNRTKDYLKDEIVKEDGSIILFKRPYVTKLGAISKNPDCYTLLNGKNVLDFVRKGKETHIECVVVPNVNDDNLLEIINILQKERNLTDWEKCEKALSFLPPSQQGQEEGRWDTAIRKAGVDISKSTLERYHKIKCFDEETKKQYDLINRIKGVGIDGKEPLTIATARALVSRYEGKQKLKDKHPNQKIVVDEIYTDLIQDYHIWQQDNREPWLISDESLQLVFTSPHYFNQRKYTKEDVIYEAQTLDEYLNDLLLTFTQAKKKLKKDGVLGINIADTHKLCENYLVIQRLCLALADKLGFIFLFKQIWAKTNGLSKGRETTPVYDYEEILYFSKSKDYYCNPLKYYNLEKPVTLDYYLGRDNPDGSKTSAKWIVSKEYETFSQFIKQNEFAAVIETGTASADSRAIKEKYGEKHPAVMPLVIPLYPILCFTKPGDIVFEPWVGTGTTLKVALATGRKARGIDLEERFVKIANSECQDIVDLFK